MKLIDILARDLKSFLAVLGLEQSFDGMVYYLDEANQAVPLVRTELADDWRVAYVTPAEWQAAIDALNAQKAGEWNGEGFPPVDTICELRKKNGGWGQATIKYMSQTTCVWLWDNGNPDQREWACEPWDMEFRTIRTTKQIAAEKERSKACDKMFGVILDKIPQDRRNNGSDICEALYDAGYRKFEIVDE